jgi:Helicase associated domain
MVEIYHEDPMHIMGDDDPFLFTADQLEEELIAANSGVLDTSDGGDTAADSVPSLQTADSNESGRPKRKRKPSTRLQEANRQQSEQQSKAKPAVVPPEPEPAPAPPKPTPKERKPPAKRRKSVKKKYEPLAPQVIPSRSNRQKLFTWSDRMVQLADYKEKFGHVAIPTVRRDPYYNLGLWLAAQRSLYRKNSLKKERLNELRELGCVGFGSN